MADQNGGGSVSVGEEDQQRDAAMLRQLQDEDQQQAKRLDHPHELRSQARPTPPSRDEPWHPGDAAQPSRTESAGLTGSGPAQPDP